MNRTSIAVVVFALSVVAALALRLPALDFRPVHSDEAVHTYKCNELWTQGTYRYDPSEYHGPTLYYFTVPILAACGAENWRDTSFVVYRLVPALFGVGLILLSLLLRDGLGSWPVVVAALLTAVSPAMVFYSRHYVQEMQLVFFTLLLIAAGWRYVHSAALGWAVLAGFALGMMHASKETAALAGVALLGAVVLTILLERPRVSPAQVRRSLRPRPLLVALGVAVVVSAVHFSHFFTNPRAIVDSLLTYFTYADRAVAGDHLNPWYFYFRVLFWTHYPPAPVFSELLIGVLTVIGFIAALVGRGLGDANRGLVRVIAFYTVLLTVIYSVIPYKTPWSALGFFHGMILLAGIGATVLVRVVYYRPLQVAAVVVLLAFTVQLSQQARRASFQMVTDVRNPHIYGHPVAGVNRMIGYLEQLAAAAPSDAELVVKVIVDNPWPLPWYLRHLEHVGYWSEIPDDPDANIIIASATLADALEPRFHDEYDWSYCGFRRDETLIVYVRQDLRAAFVAANSTPTSAPAADR